MYNSPVRHFHPTEVGITFDLHVLSTPPAFILSQDQTLHKESLMAQILIHILIANLHYYFYHSSVVKLRLPSDLLIT